MSIIVDDDGIMHDVYSKKEVIDMLTRIRMQAWKHHSKFHDDIDLEVDEAIEDVVGCIDEQINDLRG